MIGIAEWIWFASLLIVTGYHQVVFRRKPDTSFRPLQDWPGVSIVIAHKNHAAQLLNSLPSITKQDYLAFEILIVDNESTTSELALLKEGLLTYPQVKLLSAQGGKKDALTHGVQNAQYIKILCIDADCQPVSDQWIKLMVSKARGQDIVLGFSPYNRVAGWLNTFIRFETVMTAIQYMSWSLAGRPYMGVGRNMMYGRDTFLRYQPYKDNDVPYGDDDQLVQKLAHHVQVRICANQEAHVSSIPSTTFRTWIVQKHRHLSAAHHYPGSRLWQPGLYGLALVMHWGLLPGLMLGSPYWKWLPVMVIGLLIRWWTYRQWNCILKQTDTVIKYPLLEINYAVYLGVMGLYALVSKKRTWN